MEFKKETEKFSCGFGTEKIAGKGDLSNAVNVSEKSQKRELLEIICSVAAVAITFFIRSGALKKKKKRKK